MTAAGIIAREIDRVIPRAAVDGIGGGEGRAQGEDVVAAAAMGGVVAALDQVEAVGQSAAGEHVVAVPGEDGEAAVRFGRSVEGEAVAGAEPVRLDAEMRAGGNGFVGRDQIVIEAGREFEGFDAGDGGGAEHHRRGIIALEHEPVVAGTAIDRVGRGEGVAQLEAVLAVAAIGGVVAALAQFEEVGIVAAGKDVVLLVANIKHRFPCDVRRGPTRPFWFNFP